MKNENEFRTPRKIREEYGISDDDGILYDVLAVSRGSRDEEIPKNTILWIDKKHTASNADAIICMAIGRQGTSDRYYTKIPHGTYQEGEIYDGTRQPQ